MRCRFIKPCCKKVSSCARWPIMKCRCIYASVLAPNGKTGFLSKLCKRYCAVFKRLCLIGTGLIGGSIARAARSQGLCDEIVAFGREKNLANLQLAKDLGVIDRFYTDMAVALEQAD